ncbi:TPA: hypothetical protein SHT56_002146 [Pseudomonas aeruginosa]|nr:hypothetical protein [Pseudomonas aeruginosa]
MKPIIFDTETTGTDHKTDQIIEAAWLELPERPYQFSTIAPAELPHYHERFKPDVPISLGAQAVHHIICQDLVGCRESKEFALPAGPLYDRLYRHWHRLERNALADGARDRIECLWLNDAARSGLAQLDIFHDTKGPAA